MCFSKIFDLSSFSKRVLKSDKYVCDDDDNDDDDDDDDENDDFWWFLNLNKFFKTHLRIVRPVVNNFKSHWGHFHWWWSLGGWGNNDGDA